jgi:hypothetical protein
MPDYRERLHVPLAWWLLAIPTILILGGELYAGFGGVVPLVIYGVFTAGYAGFLFAWGRAVTEVSDGTLRAGGAVLRLTDAGDVVALDEKQSARLRGPRADPSARLCLRPYLKRAVYIGIDEPAGEIPYWLIGSRRPEQLAAAINSSRAGLAGKGAAGTSEASLPRSS